MPIRKARVLTRKRHMTTAEKRCQAPGCETLMTKSPEETQEQYDSGEFCRRYSCQAHRKDMEQARINRQWDQNLTSPPVVYSSKTDDGKARIAELVASGAIKTPHGYRFQPDTASFVAV